MKIEEVRGKTDAELEYEVGELKKELFHLRFKAASETSNNPSRIKTVRRTIARINTVALERKTGVRGQEPH